MVKSQPDELVDEIEHIRNRLAGTVDELLERTSPKKVLHRKKAEVKAHFVDEHGSVRLENVIPVAAGAAVVLGVLLVIRRIVR